MELRNSKAGDEDQVLGLVRAVLAEYGLKTNPATTDKDLDDIQSQYPARGGIFRILEVDGKIVGSYGLYKISDSTCELRKMYLLPKYHGQGFGRKMMDDALSQAKQTVF